LSEKGLKHESKVLERSRESSGRKESGHRKNGASRNVTLSIGGVKTSVRVRRGKGEGVTTEVKCALNEAKSKVLKRENAEKEKTHLEVRSAIVTDVSSGVHRKDVPHAESTRYVSKKEGEKGTGAEGDISKKEGRGHDVVRGLKEKKNGERKRAVETPAKRRKEKGSFKNRRSLRGGRKKEPHTLTPPLTIEKKNRER